jgi:hypothetical protein
MVAPFDRLASASVVFFGHHGDVSHHAGQRGVSRQRLYREANRVLRDLDPRPQQQQLDCLQQQFADLRSRLQLCQDQLSKAVVLDADKLAQFAATAQAEGVSLPVTRVLLSVFLGDKAPSVPQLGRFSRQAGLRAGPLLEVFDKHARPLACQASADEIFFGQKPVLMTVEPESQCWLGGRLASSRDGQQWAKELEQLPALEHLVRDGAKGIQNGLARVNKQRQERRQKLIGDQEDHFHTLREGRRALRKTQAKAERAWTAAEQADKKVAQQNRQGQSRSGYATQAVLKWQKAEEAFEQWDAAEQALEQIRQTLRPFTASGELNSRQKASQAIEAVLPVLTGEHWDKFKRLLLNRKTYTYLDRLHQQIEALKVPAEVKEAVVASEGIRQNPELVQGNGQRQAVMRGLLVVWGVMIASAGDAGQQAVAALRQMLRCVGRASSCVEGLNSVVRMQQGRHRKMTQELLDLKRLYWNLRKFRTGRRRKTAPLQRLGVALPAGLCWWQLLQLTPDQLRAVARPADASMLSRNQERSLRLFNLGFVRTVYPSLRKSPILSEWCQSPSQIDAPRAMAAGRGL